MGGCFSSDNFTVIEKDTPKPIQLQRDPNEPISGISRISMENNNLFAKISAKDREQIYQKVDD